MARAALTANRFVKLTASTGTVTELPIESSIKSNPSRVNNCVTDCGLKPGT